MHLRWKLKQKQKLLVQLNTESKWQLHSSGRTENSTMDRHQQISNLSKSIALSSPTRLPAGDWPASDKPPHYYASQNNCNVKMISSQLQPAASNRSQPTETTEQQERQNSLLASIQRKLFAVLYIYAILIVSLYLTYAAYYFLQQHQRQTPAISGARARASMAQELRSADNTQDTGESVSPPSEAESKLETKLHLLERYMELIAIDLQETKEKLREREKCDCSMSCHFNGTRYEDRSSWQQQCDMCSCRMGKISCQPKKCPPLQCQQDQAITLAGQCCPTCMRQCKYNKMLYKHGEKFQPASRASTTSDLPQAKNNQTSSKICQCLDGRIKCEQKSTAPTNGLRASSSDQVQASSRQQAAAETTTTQQPTFGGRRKASGSSDIRSRFEPKAARAQQQASESPPPLPAADQIMPL